MEYSQRCRVNLEHQILAELQKLNRRMDTLNTSAAGGFGPSVGSGWSLDFRSGR